MAKLPETNVSKQVQPIRLQSPLRPIVRRAETRLGALTSRQMRGLSREGIPGICKSTLIDQAVVGITYEVLNPEGEADAQTEFSTMVLENANNGQGSSSFFSRVADDMLTTTQGGMYEVFLGDGDVPLALYNVDSVTMFPTFNEDMPWEQRLTEYVRSAVEVSFRPNEMAQVFWRPLPEFGQGFNNWTPIAQAYMYLSIAAASDDWNLDMLSDQFPATVLVFPGASEEEARAFKEAWDYAIAGGNLQDIAVMYGVDLKQAQNLRLTRPPTDMAFEVTNHWYSSLIAAAFEMSILDISILTRVSTKAAAESQESISQQQGQRKLRKAIAESIEKFVLPEGYTFNWVIPKPEDEAAQAAAVERRSRAFFYVTQAVGDPARAEELAREMGILPAHGKVRRPEYLSSKLTIKDLVVKADLEGVISLGDWDRALDGIFTFAEKPPEDLWGEDLYYWAEDAYTEELDDAYERWYLQAEEAAEIEEDERRESVLLALALAFKSTYLEALQRASYRAYVAGKQRNAENLTAALAIAAAAFTVVELDQIQSTIARDETYFDDFVRVLADEGIEYTRAKWRTELYPKLLWTFFLNGIIHQADPDLDLIEITQGSEEPCGVCPQYWGKLYTVSEYESLGPPPSSWCEYGTACRCDIRIHRRSQ